MTASVSASTRRAAVTKGAGSGCVRTAAVIAVMCKPLTLLPAARTAAKRMPDARLFFVNPLVFCRLAWIIILYNIFRQKSRGQRKKDVRQEKRAKITDEREREERKWESEAARKGERRGQRRKNKTWG